MSILSLLGVGTAYAATAATTAAPHHASYLSFLLPILILVVFYLLLIRPQQKRAKDQRRMLDKVAMGDEVMTAGGIMGKVVRLRDNYIVVEISKGVEITIQRSSIASILPKGTLDSMS